MEQKSKGGRWILIMFLIFALMLAVASCSDGGSGSSSSSSTKTCPVCHRTFNDSENKRSIAFKNMCKNCYSNYEWSMKATGKK